MGGKSYEVNPNGVEEVLVERIFLISKSSELSFDGGSLTAYLRRRQDLPTPLFPMSNSLKR